MRWRFVIARRAGFRPGIPFTQRALGSLPELFTSFITFASISYYLITFCSLICPTAPLRVEQRWSKWSKPRCYGCATTTLFLRVGGGGGAARELFCRWSKTLAILGNFSAERAYCAPVAFKVAIVAEQP